MQSLGPIIKAASHALWSLRWYWRSPSQVQDHATQLLMTLVFCLGSCAMFLAFVYRLGTFLFTGGASPENFGVMDLVLLFTVFCLAGLFFGDTLEAVEKVQGSWSSDLERHQVDTAARTLERQTEKKGARRPVSRL